jgi:type IV pilus assembly protein PilE
MKMRKYMSGVTLIELMITVVIIAILAVISYPSYREFIDRAKRTEAKAALLMAATNQERFFLQNNQFSALLTDLGFTTSPFTTDSGAYVITVAAAVPTADFTVTATYQLGGSEAAKCNVFTITGAGIKTSTPDTDCWTRTR